MFTPKWKKEAEHLAKAARKFVNYKRDLLEQDRIDEIESRRGDLLAAIKSGDKAKVAEASKMLRVKCDGALPKYQAPNWVEENVEVMFVAIVIALGLRAYFLQPFRIPTGSMQPTLNGIIGTQKAEAQWPSAPVRLAEAVLRGRSYVKVVNDRDRRLRVARSRDGDVYTDMQDFQVWQFFSRSALRFADGSILEMPAPSSQIYQAGLQKVLQDAVNKELAHHGGRLPADMSVSIPAGTVLCEGTVDAGDLVLVDKVSYHFRKPKRGEVFVFDTRGIEGTRQSAGGGEQAGGTHYIKRLVGVPGDELQLSPPHLLVKGKIAQEPGIERVYTLPLSKPSREHPDHQSGYTFADGKNYPQAFLKDADSVLSLKDQAPVGMREYAAFGDNSANSLDSRYWGTVKEFNLSGPALFSLWPITSGHWGFIK